MVDIFHRDRSPRRPYRLNCVRCKYTWRSTKEHPRCCPGCRVNNWDKPARDIKYKIDQNTPVGGRLIFAPFVLYQSHNRLPETPLPGMPRGCDTRFEHDSERARITQATIERKLKKMGIPFRYAVLPNGVMYIRTA